MYRRTITGPWPLLVAGLLLAASCDEEQNPLVHNDKGGTADLRPPTDAARDVATSDADGAGADAGDSGPSDGGCEGDGTRSCYTGDPVTRGVGPCKGGTQTCVGGKWSKCVGEITPVAELCDSKDNDCDGSADEYLTQACYSGATGTKGVGPCKEGAQLCLHGKWQSCIGEVVPVAELCDNKDNDCDGTVDNKVTQACYSGPSATRKVGTCSDGTQACVAGSWGACSGDVKPTAELCDGKDNDCDGKTDEDVTTPCYSGAAGTQGVGACKAGTQSCIGGTPGICNGEVTPSSELCDNKDNDCNGKTDEGLTQACYSGTTGTQGVGTCKAGVQTCNAGTWSSCVGEVTPKTEDCDNKDNNCNGKTDESLTKYCYSGAAGTKGVGLCKEGLQLCSGGSWGTCSGEVVPVAEKCDNKDNDCDGSIDESVSRACYTGQATTRNVGSCSDGIQHCAAGSWGSCTGDVKPVAEICDNKDNDCDGTVDDSVVRGCYSGAAKTKGVGICKAGVETCKAGSWGSCTGEVLPGTETCDNKDNDCDGSTDEGLSQVCYSADPATKGVGPCKAGLQGCSGGKWGACNGQVTPVTETCDNKDNDCDGTTDESVFQTCYTGSPKTAGVGECRTGYQVCNAGVFGGTCNGQVTPSTEQCDNKDNDCDSEIDEGLALGCYSGQPQHHGVGECTSGTRSCNLGTWGACSGSVLPVSEVCDGKDNDCDGTPDNGTSLCTNGNVCAGSAGCRCNGQSPCNGGAYDMCCPGTTCQNLYASTEHCGACWISCGANESCSAGRCQCGTKQGTVGGGAACSSSTDCCGGACVDLQTDGQNCGQCGAVCATNKCVKGACVGSCNTNHALTATATSSGGGAGTLGPQRMNDNVGCGSTYHWVAAGSSAGGAWIQYNWSSSVQIKHLVIDTVDAYVDQCGANSTGRTAAGGAIQYWNGSSWIGVGTVSGQQTDWTYTLPSSISTTRLRIYGIHATSVTGYKSNPIIIEWKVFSC